MIEKLHIFNQISLKFLSNGPNDNKSALVQVMAWHWTGNKPLPEPVMTHFTEAYVSITKTLKTLTYWGRDEIAPIS